MGLNGSKDLQSKFWNNFQPPVRSSPPEVFSGKSVLKIYSKFTGEHLRKSVISIKLPCNYIEILKLHFSMGILLWIYCIFSEHFFLRLPLEGCFCPVFGFINSLPYGLKEWQKLRILIIWVFGLAGIQKCQKFLPTIAPPLGIYQLLCNIKFSFFEYPTRRNFNLLNVIFLGLALQEI